MTLLFNARTTEDETIHESERKRSRRGIASYFRRLARALGRGERVPIDEVRTVTVDPPADTDFEVYGDTAEEWRWRLRHRNGNIIADSSQGYASKQKPKQGLRSVRINSPGAPVEDVES